MKTISLKPFEVTFSGLRMHILINAIGDMTYAKEFVFLYFKILNMIPAPIQIKGPDVMKNKSPSAELVFNRENGMMKRTSGSKVVSSRSGRSSRSIMMLLILTVVRVSNCSGAAL